MSLLFGSIDKKKAIPYTVAIYLSHISSLLFCARPPWCTMRAVQEQARMALPSLLDMLKAGVHFGHQSSRWHPKMDRFIFTRRHGVHIIDLEKTLEELDKTLPAVKAMVAEGKKILFVSTKPQAKAIVKAAAERCGQPYLVDRWIGGLLTNFPEIKKRINTYNDLKSQQASGELEKYTKKERLDIAKMLEKMDVNLAGLKDLTKMPDAIFVPALQREKTAVTEATRTGVEIIGVCDTNANPDVADHIIPANDDAVNAIELIVNLVADAAAEGQKEFEKKKNLAEKAADKKESK